MLKFSRRQEEAIKYRINMTFTLIGTILFCIRELMDQSEDVTLAIIKIILVVLFFWLFLGRIASLILYSLLKESVEDQVEMEDDLRRRKEIHDFEAIEKSEARENVQKVKF